MISAIVKIGPYELFAVETGTFGLDGGAMFGVVPKPLWQKKTQADERNRIPLAARALLLKSSDKNILIDVGLGDKWSEKEKDIYAIDHTSNDLLQSLQRYGLKAEDIHDVLLTHLHFDHCGGSTKIDSSSHCLIPTFPHATYYVQEKNWIHARKPTLRDRASYLKADFEALGKADQLQLLTTPDGFDHDEEILPGIQALICNGHTPGLQMIKVADHEQSVVYCADTIPTFAHLPVPWVMAYDLEPLKTLEEKAELLKRCFQKNWKLFFEHDPKVGLAEITEDDRGRAIFRP